MLFDQTAAKRNVLTPIAVFRQISLSVCRIDHDGATIGIFSLTCKQCQENVTVAASIISKFEATIFETFLTETAMRFEIHPARIEDCEVVSQLIHDLADYEEMSDMCQTTPEKMRQALFCENPVARCLLGWEVDEETDTHRPVAFALYFFNFSTFVARKGLYLEDLFVVPNARGKGYGKQMIQALGKIAAQEQCGRFEWVVLDWNTSAQEFYKKLGADVLKQWWLCRIDEKGLQDYK